MAGTNVFRGFRRILSKLLNFVKICLASALKIRYFKNIATAMA